MIIKTTVRFFAYTWDDDSGTDIEEVSEDVFLSLGGNISYERHTMFLNGVDQICLTTDKTVN